MIMIVKCTGRSGIKAIIAKSCAYFKPELFSPVHTFFLSQLRVSNLAYGG